MSKMFPVDKINQCAECRYVYAVNGIARSCMRIHKKIGNHTIHPDCPLHDYVDVEKLQNERDELVKVLKDLLEKGNVQGRFIDATYYRLMAEEALAKIKGEI